jgi:hypothetical protein
MEKRKVYRLLVGKPERKRPPKSPRHGVDNINMDLVDIGWSGDACDGDRVFSSDLFSTAIPSSIP